MSQKQATPNTKREATPTESKPRKRNRRVAASSTKTAKTDQTVLQQLLEDKKKNEQQAAISRLAEQALLVEQRADLIRSQMLMLMQRLSEEIADREKQFIEEQLAVLGLRLSKLNEGQSV